jgi:hypothetical protein
MVGTSNLGSRYKQQEWYDGDILDIHWIYVYIYKYNHI